MCKIMVKSLAYKLCFGTVDIRTPLTIKALCKIVADNILNFVYHYFFRENKIWHFLYVVCWVDDSHEMSSYFSWKKKMSSAAVLISALRIDGGFF